MDDILLVASDLDRTLLLEGGKMPPDLRDYVQRLNEQGIVFVPASGRPLATLKEMFDWPDMDLAFISDNGAVVESGGKILHQSVISPEQYLSMVEGTLTSTDGYPTLCGMNAAYLPVAARPLADQFRVYYKNLVFGQISMVSKKRSSSTRHTFRTRTHEVRLTPTSSQLSELVSR